MQFRMALLPLSLWRKGTPYGVRISKGYVVGGNGRLGARASKDIYHDLVNALIFPHIFLIWEEKIGSFPNNLETNSYQTSSRGS